MMKYDEILYKHLHIAFKWKGIVIYSEWCDGILYVANNMRYYEYFSDEWNTLWKDIL